MKAFVIRKDNWKRFFAALYLVLGGISAVLMIIGIFLSFYDVEPAGTIVILCGFNTILGLVVGLLTNPQSFALLFQIVESLSET